MFRLVVLLAALATINAQYNAQYAPTLTSQQSNIYRTFGNLGQVSTYSKSIDTPFSSVSKSDVRVSNPGIYSGLAAAHYGPSYAPALAPAYHGYAAPALARPYGLPVAKPVVATAGGQLLGVAYSAAPTVAHMTYSNGLGINYAW